jgi:hypothetical protein
MKTRGIIIPCPSKYELICLNNVKTLRTQLNNELPIEIWEIGDEISPGVRKQFESIKDCTFENVNNYADSNPNHWKGFQIKAFAIYHTKFDEVILCDADVTFFKNPEIIYNDENYIRTGAYFFKDLERWIFHDLRYNAPDKFSSIEFYNMRKGFIHSLIPKKTNLFPKEWAYLYEDKIPTVQVKEALQESGVVYIDKTRHKQSIIHIYTINYNHNETYKYVWGDKETFWIACVMSNTPFHFNSESGIMYNGRLTHFYKNEQFWRQK